MMRIGTGMRMRMGMSRMMVIDADEDDDEGESDCESQDEVSVCKKFVCLNVFCLCVRASVWQNVCVCESVCVSLCVCVCVKVSLCKGDLLFAPGAIETTFLEAHVDGGTTAPWVAAGFHTWHGLAVICFCAVKSKPQNVSTSKWCHTACECRNKSTETARDLLMHMLAFHHRDTAQAAQVKQICLRLCGVGSTRSISPMQKQSLIAFSHAVALINMIPSFMQYCVFAVVRSSAIWIIIPHVSTTQMLIYMATCWICLLLHLVNLGKASSLLFATFAPW